MALSNISIFSSYEGFGIVLNYTLDYLLHFNLLTLLYKDGQIHFYNFFYFWYIIFILLGLALSLKKYKLKNYKFILLWFILAPIGSSFIEDNMAYSLTRDVVSMPLLIILSAI